MIASVMGGTYTNRHSCWPAASFPRKQESSDPPRQKNKHTEAVMLDPAYPPATPWPAQSEIAMDRAKIDEATVMRIAHLARIKISKEEAQSLKRELNGILSWVEEL